MKRGKMVMLNISRREIVHKNGYNLFELPI